MDIKQCRVGMYVLINHDIKNTKRKYDASDQMYMMIGSKFPIENRSVSYNHVTIKGYTWDPSDITLYKEEKEVKPNIFLFDESVLQ